MFFIEPLVDALQVTKHEHAKQGAINKIWEIDKINSFFVCLKGFSTEDCASVRIIKVVNMRLTRYCFTMSLNSVVNLA